MGVTSGAGPEPGPDDASGVPAWLAGPLGKGLVAIALPSVFGLAMRLWGTPPATMFTVLGFACVPGLIVVLLALGVNAPTALQALAFFLVLLSPFVVSFSGMQASSTAGLPAPATPLDLLVNVGILGGALAAWALVAAVARRLVR